MTIYEPQWRMVCNQCHRDYETTHLLDPMHEEELLCYARSDGWIVAFEWDHFCGLDCLILWRAANPGLRRTMAVADLCL